MLNEILRQLRRYDMVSPGDRVICAVSGGADSMALLWSMYLLREKLGICLEAAHFNHQLRGAESQRDEDFVRAFCSRYDIPLHLGSTRVTAGKKGLEAAAREARYAFLDTLPGKIATAHTADDNAETVLMHLVRGTGLKGLGGIAPVSGRRIRPMLTVTRRQVLALLEEYHIAFVADSSNESDAFFRNRLRHHVMPLLRQENPRLAESLSEAAQRLRQDEAALAALAGNSVTQDVGVLRQMDPAVRSRVLEGLLRSWGVSEPESSHIALAEKLIFSENPSARAQFPGNVTVQRYYGRLEKREQNQALPEAALPHAGSVELPRWHLKITVAPADALENGPAVFTVVPQGEVVLRSRQSGDSIRLTGGTKSLKKLFIDRKIPSAQRQQVPVLADSRGVLGVYGIGVNLDRAAQALPALQIRLEATDNMEVL